MNLELPPEHKVLKKLAGIFDGRLLFKAVQQKIFINSIESLRNLGESHPVAWITQGQRKETSQKNRITRVTMKIKLLVSLLSITMLSSCVCKRVGDQSGLGDGTSPNDSIPTASSAGPLKDINFDFDSSQLTATATQTLSAHAAWIKAHPNASVKIEGHCDERGTNEYNLALGERRAQAAFDHLRTLGVNAAKLSTITYGEEVPLDPAHTESAYAKNRRAHFAVKE